ncbi:hypothetical protein AURDEDRAFT_123545 [Auricularia subglabra TFB-10046 SS5]|nr:hypothetical protein AURDEDRAFT_123545 [Auricularia subglabra TFB-10046 SS5]
MAVQIIDARAYMLDAYGASGQHYDVTIIYTQPSAPVSPLRDGAVDAFLPPQSSPIPPSGSLTPGQVPVDDLGHSTPFFLVSLADPHPVAPAVPPAVSQPVVQAAPLFLVPALQPTPHWVAFSVVPPISQSFGHPTPLCIVPAVVPAVAISVTPEYSEPVAVSVGLSVALHFVQVMQLSVAHANCPTNGDGHANYILVLVRKCPMGTTQVDGL